ncbi:MAG: TIGR03086 family metal-binding protein [Aeromicrobium sp.]
MSSSHESIATLSRALDQIGDVLAAIRTEQLSDPTPCEDWDLAHLMGHVLDSPARFTEAVRGGDPDWSTPPEPASGDWAAQFRSDADDLIHAWHQQGDQAEGAADWQIAEFAVHTWDLVKATRQDRHLDPEVAERGYAFMSQGLTPENRGQAFDPEVEAPETADPYDRIAAFAGRHIPA